MSASAMTASWRLHAVDASLLVRIIDSDDDEPPPAAAASSSAAAAAASARRSQHRQLTTTTSTSTSSSSTKKAAAAAKKTAVTQKQQELDQLRQQIAAREAAATGAVPAASATSAPAVAAAADGSAKPGKAARPKRQVGQANAAAAPAPPDSPAKRRKAAAKPPAAAAAGPSTALVPAGVNEAVDDERPLTDGQLRRVLGVLRASGLLLAPEELARAQEVLRPLAMLKPLEALPAPAPAVGGAAASGAAAAGGAAQKRRRGVAEGSSVAAPPPAKAAVAPTASPSRSTRSQSKAVVTSSKSSTAKAVAAPSGKAPAPSGKAAAALARATSSGTAAVVAAPAAAPTAAQLAAAAVRASATLRRHAERLAGAAASPASASLMQQLLDCRACERFVPWWSPTAVTKATAPPTAVGMAGPGWYLDVQGEPDAAVEAGDGEGGNAGAAAVRSVDELLEDESVLDAIRNPEYTESPLLCLRAYRLSPYYSAPQGCGMRLSGPFSRQRLDPSRPMCRFELTGDCRDPLCSGQHRRQYMQSVPELCSELRAYAGPAAKAPADAAGDGTDDEEEHEQLAQQAVREARAALRAQVAGGPALQQANGTPYVPIIAAAAKHAVGAAARYIRSRDQPAHAPREAERAAGGGAKARRERAAQTQLLQAALAALPEPSPFAQDLEEQLQPLLLTRRASEAAALEGVPSHAPTQGLAPTIAIAQRAATSANASSVALDEFLGETGGGGLRYWHSTDLSLSDDAASVKRLIEQLPTLKEPKTCFRQILEWLGGDVRSAGAAQRSAARRLLSRLVEHRPGCASLWAQLLAVYSCDGSAEQLTQLLRQAVRHAPLSLTFWHALARLQPKHVQRLYLMLQALDTVREACRAGACPPLQPLRAALTYLHEQCEAGNDSPTVQGTADGWLSSAGTEHDEINNSLTSLLPALPLATLWLARVELHAFGSVRQALCVLERLELGACTDHAGGSSGSSLLAGDAGWRLPWHECERLDTLAATLRPMLANALLSVRSNAPHEPSLGLWLLQLNFVMMELALREHVRAEALVQSFLRHGLAAPAGNALWWLYELVMHTGAAATAAAPADPEAPPPAGPDRLAAPVPAPSPVGSAACPSVRTLWEARLAQPAPSTATDADAPQFECWHALLLSSAESRSQAMQLVALAAYQHSAADDDDAAALGAWCAPDASGALTAEEPSDEMAERCTALLQRLLQAARGWPGERARERLYLHLLWAAWLQMSAPSTRVGAAFESTLEAGVLPPSLRPLVWLRYLHWVALPATGWDSRSVLRLLRRFIAEPPPPRHRAAASAQAAIAAAPAAAREPEEAVGAAADAAFDPFEGKPFEGEALGIRASARKPWTGGSYDELADGELQSLLRVEPLASFFRGCGPRAKSPHAEAEQLCLAAHLVSPRAPHPHPALAPTEQMPPTLRLQLAARAIFASDVARARTLLATAGATLRSPSRARTPHPMSPARAMPLHACTRDALARSPPRLLVMRRPRAPPRGRPQALDKDPDDEDAWILYHAASPSHQSSRLTLHRTPKTPRTAPRCASPACL